MKQPSKYFSESTLSLVLGIVVVLILGVVAYKIFKGQVAVAPQSETQQTQTQEGNNSSGQITTPTAAVSLPTEHTVTAGENLWSIAQAYYNSGYNWVDIAKANGLTNSNEIFVGQKLTIPNVAVREPSVVSEQPVMTPVVTTAAISGNSYTVIHGDNLWDIAVRAYGDGFRWTGIATANHLANPRIIHAGNILTIPRP